MNIVTIVLPLCSAPWDGSLEGQSTQLLDSRGGGLGLWQGGREVWRSWDLSQLQHEFGAPIPALRTGCARSDLPQCRVHPCVTVLTTPHAACLCLPHMCVGGITPNLEKDRVIGPVLSSLAHLETKSRHWA